MMRGSRSLAPIAALAISIATVLGIAGCPATGNPTIYMPITGIEIIPSSLLDGLQCGQGDNEVYRYVAVVSNVLSGEPSSDAGSDADGESGNKVRIEAGTEVDGGRSSPIASNVFDCFAVGLFENLIPSAGGSQQYFVEIFAYSKQSLPGDFTCPGGLSLDGGVCLATDADASVVQAKNAQWTSTCIATQQQGIPVLAVCQPLAPQNGDAAIRE